MILVQDLLKEAKRLSAGARSKPDEKKQPTTLKAKRRYQHDITGIYARVASVIVEARLLNFGSLLKGQDYECQHRIDRKDFFRTIQSIPEMTDGPQGLKEGDIIDLVCDLDENNDGYIALSTLK